MKFTKKKAKTIIDKDDKEVEGEDKPTQEDMDQAKDMLALLQAMHRANLARMAVTA